MSMVTTIPLTFALAVSAINVQAAELQPPRTLQASGLVATPSPGAGCSAPGALGPRRDARLIVRDALRTDVGPYKVQLPGYSSGDENLYRPFLINASPGDTLRIDLENQLAPPSDPSIDNHINIHTHGLIVSPRPCTPFGYSVYVEVAPNGTSKYAITIPATLPGAQFAGGGANTPYPVGLNWFHAHVHKKARIDVMAGQSGMLEVGDLLSSLRTLPGITPQAKAMLDATDVAYLGLRDIQLALPPGQTPDLTASQGAVGQWLKADLYDPGACPGQVFPPPNPPVLDSFSKPGFCARHKVKTASGFDETKDTVWLFTVNGQAYPTLSAKVDRNQVWRIANLSANVSYRLELTADNDPKTPLPMDVLSVDGVIAGTATAGGGLSVGVQLKHLLLMPAGRAEVFVPALAQGDQPMTFRTAGFSTGPDGDSWPIIDLMHVVPPVAPAAAVAALRVRPQALAARAQFPSIVIPRQQPFVEAVRISPTQQAAAKPPENCITLPVGQVVRRRITFQNSGAEFWLGSEVVTADGVSIDPTGSTAHTIPPQPFPAVAMQSPGSVPHICPRFGEQEVWELVNVSGELHNFHIHQSKFRLSVASDLGVPQGPLGITDPGNVLVNSDTGAAGATPDAGVDVWHDTLPVPPAGPSGPGRVFVTIPFHARQQIGFFVFHCHILEHEDNGMMAVVQVFDPAHPKLTADMEPAGGMHAMP